MKHCEQLLKLCGTDIFDRNAFRLLDVNVDQKHRQIKRREKDLISAIEHDDLIDEFQGMFCPDPLPTHEELSQASKALSDPQQRFIYEFFWFWPIEWNNSKSDEILKLIRAGEGDKAQEQWMALAELDGDSALVAKHNLAVLSHFWILQIERDILESENDLTLTAEKRQELDQYWNWAFYHWEYLCESEPFWKMLANRVCDLGDERLTTDFVHCFAETLPIAFDNINADMAAAYCQKKIYTRAKDHIKIMVATNSGEDDVTFSLRRITDPLHARIDKAIETATENLMSNQAEGLDRCIELYYTISEILGILQILAGESSPEFNDVRDRIADSMRRCLVAYGNHTENWADTLPLMKQALKIAIGKETVEKVKQDFDAYKQNDEQNQCWFCQHQVRSSDSDYTVDMYRIVTFNSYNIINKDPDVMEIINCLPKDTIESMLLLIKIGQELKFPRTVEVMVPRCPDCKKEHAGLDMANRIITLISIVVFVISLCPIAYAKNDNFKDDAWRYIFPAFVLVSAMILMKIINFILKKEIGIKGVTDIKKFPPIKELLHKEWHTGKPPASQFKNY